MPLELPPKWFSSKGFSLITKIFVLFDFYTFLDFGIDNYSNWLNNWFDNLILNNLESNSYFLHLTLIMSTIRI